MPLTLVTGPANSAKAGEVLGGLRARLDDEPVLVVPNFEDVEHAQRELAERGAVFGARVVRFAWLFEAIAGRAGYAAPVASEVQRGLLVEEAIRDARLRLLAESAAQPGFARAATRFVAELARSMVDAGRLERALRDWKAAEPEGGAARYADEAAAIYRRYRERLDAAGLVDRELFARRALDALRREPARWGRTPVFVYGFDDFTPLELDALETLAGRCEADVCVSLPFEPGRIAFKAVAPVYGRLEALATRHVALPPLSDHYEEASRGALHRLERDLFELAGAQPGDPRPALRLHAAGGERAEVELAGAEVLRLLRDGTEPGDIAVVFRDPTAYASLLQQVFGAYGIPYSIDRSVRLEHTSLGRALLALVRCAVLGGSADDLLTYLRAPGKLDEPALADRLESQLRRQGARTAADARTAWERERWPLREIDRLRAARGPAELIERLDRELERLFSGPYRRRAPVLAGPELEDARAFAAAHDALRDLHALARSGARLGLDHARVHATLAELPVRVGDNPQPDRVQVASPEAVRARRFAAVLVCGLQEGEFPRGSAPEPFLPDDDRRAIAAASGLRLPLREDPLDRERYLFYVCVSRAERLLVLSSRSSDEEGRPQAPSFFLDDVRDLFLGLDDGTRRRSLSQVTWSPEGAPTDAERDRALAVHGSRPPREPAPTALGAEPLLRELAATEAVSAGALERFADCPVKWLVEDVLRPDALEPDPEAMVRGRYAHAVLERTYRRLAERTGSMRMTRESLPEAERILLEELRERRSEFRISADRSRVRAAVRRLEFDLLRYLRHEAGSGGLFRPEHLELRFGDGERPVELGEGVRVRGVIDRVDTWNGYGLVRDYKTGKSADAYKVASWEEKNRLQAPLYMLAVREVLGLEPAGGVYVPLGGTERRPRGMVAAEIEELGSDFFAGDRLPREEFEATLELARARIADTVRRMRAGELGCSPETCAWNGRCSYPSICRTED